MLGYGSKLVSDINFRRWFMIKMKNLIIMVFLFVISFGVLSQEVITASAISLNEAIENLENKAKEKDSTIVKITFAGGKNYIRASAIIEKNK